jgi:CDP-diacylglycerol--glycerol-3-phosphate 3-phosphatidyltransferase
VTGALIALAAGGLLLMVLVVATAQPPSSVLPDREAYLTRWSQLHGGITPSRGPTRWWLGLVYVVAGPLARRGWQPNAVTLLGLWAFSALLPPAYAAGRWPLLGAPIVAFAGLMDGLDGGVAVLTGRATTFGYVLDSVVDRLAEVLALVALFALGAATGLVVAAGGAAALLEYTRARASGAGPGVIGRLTPGERPTRLVLIGAGMLGAGVFPAHARLAVSLAAGMMLAICGLSFAWLLADLSRRLSRSSD